MLAVACTWCSPMPYGLAITSIRRWATPCTSSAPRKSSSTITNSSPPRRAVVCPGAAARPSASLSRTIVLSRPAIRRSSASPTACPSVTLRRWNRSQLTNSTANSYWESSRAAARACSIRSSTTARLGIEVRLSVRLTLRKCDVSRCCSRCTEAVTSCTLAISAESLIFRSLISSVWGRAPGGPSGRIETRNASQMTPLGESCAAASSRNCGATGARASNRLTSSPPGAGGINSRADIGLIIVIVPSSVFCIRPMGA